MDGNADGNLSRFRSIGVRDSLFCFGRGGCDDRRASGQGEDRWPWADDDVAEELHQIARGRGVRVEVHNVDILGLRYELAAPLHADGSDYDAARSAHVADPVGQCADSFRLESRSGVAAALYD